MAKSAIAPYGLVQLTTADQADLGSGLKNELCYAVSPFDSSELSGGVKQHHCNFTAIVRINDTYSLCYGQPLYGTESAARIDKTGNAGELGISKEMIAGAIEALGLPSSVRGEALTLEQFAGLSNIICGMLHESGGN